MDRYFVKVAHPLKLSELHLIGITCMFIASKYEEIDPLFVGTVVMRIGKNKYSLDTILNKEKEILNILRFRLNAVPTVLEFVERYLSH